jgi:2-oxoglutarate dehydrogenase E2 component (dihydrolipoamide succinyltransferase)
MEIIVPKLGESVTEATISKWLKNIGDMVSQDEPIVEVETDKITMEVHAPSSGELIDIRIPAGQTVSIGAVIGKINPEAKGKTLSTPSLIKENVLITPQKLQEPILSPAAQKMATEQKVDPTTLQGSGKGGRIMKEDVVSASLKTTNSITESTMPEERVKMTRLRQRIAERLKESQNTAAMLTTFNEIDMSNVMAMRAKYKDVFEKKHGAKLGFMSFFTKACIAILKEIPALNAEIDGDEIVYKHYHNIGIAVGTENGLVVPVLRDADLLDFPGIEKAIAAMGEKARQGKLSMNDLTHGTFTISNGGVYGSLMSTPILNPPQSGILGLHKIQNRPIAIEDEVKIRPMMYTALTYDHRIIDGKEAVTFLVRVKDLIEDPQRLLLEI